MTVLLSGWLTLLMIQMEISRMATAYPTSPSIIPKNTGNANANIMVGSTSFDSGTW